MYSLRQLASTGSTRLGFALGRFGGRRGVSATSSAAAPVPVPGDQGVGMDPARQKPHSPEPEGKQQDDTHTTTHGDVMTDSFGAGYSTRSDEEGFGGVYGQNDPEYRTSLGSKEKKEKVRHVNDDKHATKAT